MRSTDGCSDSSHTQQLQDADSDHPGQRAEMDPAPPEDGAVEHGSLPVVGIDVRRDDASGLVEVSP